ncbi:MAG TPA: hypothetical protein DDX98_14500 [Bacteroidales bacterium]|nr:hypothetical protein [Bacteroidales bacterium]
MKVIKLLALLVFPLGLSGQIPEGYYNAAEGKTGYELKTALHNIIKEHTNKGYSALWGFISINDLDIYYENDGSVLDIYSENPTGPDAYNFIESSDQCGNYSGEGSCYNREHSFPKSWFGGSINPMYADVHHIFPTDGQVNSYRGSYPYGNVTSPTLTTQNGSKRGNSSHPGYSGVVFEPIDEFKGDVARAHFYIATRYQDVITGWENNSSSSNAVLNGTSTKVFEDWALEVLLDWHKSDPVSEKEIARNNAAYSYQGNRNPFIDYPEFISCIWESICSDTMVPHDTINTACKDVFFPQSIDYPVWSQELMYINQGSSDTVFSSSIYSLIGDTTILEIDYSKLYSLASNIITLQGATYQGAIRSDSCGYVYYMAQGEDELVLYDFSKEENDTLQVDYSNNIAVESIAEETMLNSEKRNRYTFYAASAMADWIEGIGSLEGILSPITAYPAEGIYLSKLLCFLQNGEAVYKGTYGTCFPEYTHNKVLHAHNPVSVSPMPASNYLYVNIDGENQGELHLYAFSGKKILTQSANTSETRIDVADLPAGVYFLRYVPIKQSSNFVKKIVIL